MTDIASEENKEFVNSLIGNTNRTNTKKLIIFHRTYDGLGLLNSKGYGGYYVAIAYHGSGSIPEPNMKFPSSKSNCTDLNKWHVISVTWCNKGEKLTNCWSNGEMKKFCTFTNI